MAIDKSLAAGSTVLLVLKLVKRDWQDTLTD